MKLTKTVPDNDLMKKGIEILFRELGNVDVIRFLTIPRKKRVETVKFEVAVNLFKKGQISSGLAAKWLEITRVKFLLKAMVEGATLLDDSKDDLRFYLSLTRVKVVENENLQLLR